MLKLLFKFFVTKELDIEFFIKFICVQYLIVTFPDFQKKVNYWWQASLFARETIWFPSPPLFERN